MRIRDLVISAVCIVAVVTVVNLLTGNKRVASALPQSRLDHARQEAIQKPFHMRAHRLERAARLEKGSIDAGAVSEVVLPSKTGSKAVSLADTSEQIQAVEEQSAGLSFQVAASTAAELNQSKSKKNVGFNSSVHGRNKYHVVSSVGDGVYVEWQVRLCYYSYQKVKKLYPDSAMGGFTRLLHTGKADHLMEEIPTVVVDVLPDSIVRGYSVINRPFAFHQWVEKYMDRVPEEYIFMAEPDHVFVKPPPLWASPSKAVAYPFWYIQAKQHAQLISKFNEAGASIDDMNTIGSSPVILHKDMMKRATEVWYPLSVRLKTDPEADEKLGWILVKGGPIQTELRVEFMVQPPFDLQMTMKGKEAHIVHFTYGMDFNEQGAMTYGTRGTGWHFDKRDYTTSYLPRNITLPDNVDAPSIVYLLAMMNEASVTLKWNASEWRQ